MKVGVITLSLYANYGGNLQAYALISSLKDMGHDAWFINRERHKPLFWVAPLKALKRGINKYVRGRGTSVFEQRERAVVARHSRAFIEKYIQPQTPEYLTSRQLSRGISRMGFDAIVVGSDQVWRRLYVKGNLTDYFCGFLSSEDVSTRRISYAASFGISDWDYDAEETAECAKLIKRFHAVSVREDTGVELCRNNLGVDAEHVIDPTMLLSVDRYIQLIDQPEKKLSGILIYVLDPDSGKKNLIDRVVSRLGMPAFSVNVESENKKISPHLRVAPPVEDWLRGFRDASFVITDSFHGTVFAILFNKPFIACGNPGRGMARFYSLLRVFGLEGRMVTDFNSLDDLSLDPPDWVRVNEILDAQRKKAIGFLESALGVSGS